MKNITIGKVKNTYIGENENDGSMSLVHYKTEIFRFFIGGSIVKAKTSSISDTRAIKETCKLYKINFDQQVKPILIKFDFKTGESVR